MRKFLLFFILLMVCTLTSVAQTQTFHGKVLEAGTNEPLIGATVVPIGGGQGSACDLNGSFVITVPIGVHQAKISYVGYDTQVVNLHNNLVVYLHSTETSLKDVVVIAYGTGTKESLTGSVAVVDSRDIEDRPVTSATAALEGLAPGVQVNGSTTQPGEDPQIRIRGFNSIKGVNSPLYVVDGATYNGDISALNPNDIESISVLKDAASCALYGNRGANGVVLITTKKARNVGKVDLTVQIRQGIYNRAIPHYSRLGIADWMNTSLTALANGLATSTPELYDTEAAYAYYRENFVNDYKIPNIFNAADNQLFNADNKLAASVLPGYTDLDWWKSIQRNGYRQEYNVSTSSAGEKYNLFASASYLKENGYILQSDFERYNGRITANVNPVSFLKFGLNLFASQSESQKSPVEKDELGYTNNPFSMCMNKAPVMPYYMHNADGSIMLDEHGAPVWNIEDYNQTENICWNIRENQNNWTSTTLDGNIYGTAVIPYGFELTVRGQMFRNKTNNKEYSNNLVGSQKDVGALTQVFYDQRSSTFSQQLNWAHDYGQHHVDVLLNHENYEFKYGYVYSNKSGQELAGNINMDNFSETTALSEYRVKLNTESYLGRARYNYDQKYFGEVSLRRDGSSRFAKDNRWGTFWSVGASWMISKEKFMANATWINYLKLRAAYGSVGNDATVQGSSITYYPSYPLYTYGWPLNGTVSILQPDQLAPIDLRWESTKTLDVALEGSLFDDRFSFSIGYYNKRNADLIFPVSVPLSSGTMNNMGANATVLQNIGTMQNIGWELAFGVDIIRNAEFNWHFNIDASFLKNKIISLPSGQDIPGEALFQGKSLYEQYTYNWAGVDRLTGQSLYSMEPNSPDYYEYVDGKRVYNEAAYQAQEAAAEAAGALVEIDGVKYTTNRAYAGKKIMGTALPTVYGSFGTNLSWKGFNLGLLFTYSLGGKSYDSNYAGLMAITASARAIHSDALKAWTHPTSQTHSIDPEGIPQLNTTNANYNNAGSSRWLTSNDYLTFKNLNFSYDFPAKWVSAMKMQNLNLGFSVDNLFIASKRKGFNPQFEFNGDQGAYFVPARVYSFQLTVKF